MHVGHEWVERTHALEPLEVLDRDIVLATPKPNPATVPPRGCKIRVELKRPITEMRTGMEVVHKIGVSTRTYRKGDGVILAQFQRPFRQSCAFAFILRRVDHPA